MARDPALWNLDEWIARLRAHHAGQVRELAPDLALLNALAAVAGDAACAVDEGRGWALEAIRKHSGRQYFKAAALSNRNGRDGT